MVYISVKCCEFLTEMALYKCLLLYYYSVIQLFAFPLEILFCHNMCTVTVDQAYMCILFRIIVLHFHPDVTFMSVRASDTKNQLNN